ncbi:hypothetical protein GCM10022419_011570 [Nonomuraea rosea]|uniref:Uncharacterized protein n=1 Tax=Nonomuraea rosea TaxID=638574 RepID=A0ABP6VDR4_9ACTN
METETPAAAATSCSVTVGRAAWGIRGVLSSGPEMKSTALPGDYRAQAAADVTRPA